MAPKLKNLNKDIILVTLLGLIFGVLASSYTKGLQKNVEEDGNGSYFIQQFDKVSGNVYRRIEDGFVTLTVKFLYFFISRLLQLRYLPTLFSAFWTMSMSFWVAFTRSISSMPDNPLQ